MSKKSNKLFIAVVVREDQQESMRANGSWAGFTDPTLNGAVGKAMAAKEGWELRNNGPYVVLVGELKSQAVPLRQFTLVPRG